MSVLPKVVFDTQIYLRTIISFRSACGRLVLERRADYELFSSTQINEEIYEVLHRSSIRAKFPQIKDADVDLIRKTLDIATVVEVKSEDIEPICRDPKDDKFLACAKVAGADYLVSEDKDLLVLGQHHSTKIVNVAVFLGILESSQGG